MPVMRLGVEAALVDGRLVPGDVSIDGGVVQAVGLTGKGHGIAAPGFVDLQVNGFAGVDLAGADEDGYRTAGEALLATGVTAYQPTFVTAPEEALAEAVRALPRRATGPAIVGAHLEGPFLSPRRAGAHPREHLRAPDRDLLRRLLNAGRVAQVTLAPELPGALDLVDELVARGVTVACGHTDATAEQAHAAFDRGARTITHLFNAMRPPTHRDPGIAFAALGRPDVTVQLVVDGHHLAPDTVRTAYRAASGRLALVTDAAAPASAPDGDYTLGGTVAVTAERGVVRRQDGTLAGSALTMVEAVRNLHALGAPLEHALTAASTTPARIAGRHDLGRLAPGGPADVVVLDDRLEVIRVLRNDRPPRPGVH
jgi:N-acetylglucosamine-6-phosphate deacetylase